MQCLKKSVNLKEIKKIKNKNDSREIQIYKTDIKVLKY